MYKLQPFFLNQKAALLIFLITAYGFNLMAQIKIQMNEEGGVYTIPCKVNGLKLKFIFDTGASNVSISLSEAAFMLKNGYLNEANLRGSSYSQIANGDIIENTSVIIDSLEIAGIVLRDIEAIIVHDLSAPLLLGQSAIKGLGRLELNENQLIITDHNNFKEGTCEDAIDLIEKGTDYFNKELFVIAARTFQNAYDLCETQFDYYHLSMLGLSYFFSNDYYSAIKYFKRIEELNCPVFFKMLNHYDLGRAYKEIENYKNAFYYFEKALSMVDVSGEKVYYYSYSIYDELSQISYRQGDYNKSIYYSEKCIENIFKELKISEEEIYERDFSNEILGRCYWNLGLTYSKLNQTRNQQINNIKSALCGDDEAIYYCKKHYIDYYSAKRQTN